MSTELEALRRQLNTAQEILNILRNRAAGYTTLNIPADLAFDLQEKQKEVDDLKRRVQDLENRQQVVHKALHKALPCSVSALLGILFVFMISLLLLLLGLYLLHSTDVVLSHNGPEHLGDGDLYYGEPDWVELSGLCFERDFEIHLSVQSLILEMEVYDVNDRNTISLNGIQCATLTVQAPSQPESLRWEHQAFVIPSERLVKGVNSLKICAAQVSIPSNKRDRFDDFQFRALKLTSQ